MTSKKGIRLLLLLSLFIAITFQSYAEVVKEIPEDMGNTMMVLSAYNFGENKTINDLFSRPLKEGATVSYQVEGTKLIIKNDLSIDGNLMLIMETTFTCSATTCFPSAIHWESPLTFQNITVSCKGGPFDDPASYGRILGYLDLLPYFYE